MRALALKYRPKNFDDVVEQSSTVDILKNQIASGTFKQAVLFVGAAGTGKTTCARIFANEINKGRGTPDELDAASNNGVDDVRQLTDMAKMRSTDSEYRVFIIDECHMFSSGAWAALLKTIEEPPAKTVFILCTTDYWKIPKTILSRCQRFDFQRISTSGINKRLDYIAGKENIEISKEAISYIARMSDGCMREAITNLDKCVSLGVDLSVSEVSDVVGSFDIDSFVKLTNGLAEIDPKSVVDVVESTYESGKDLKQFIKSYLDFIVDVSKYELTEDIANTQLPSEDVIDRLYLDFDTNCKVHYKFILDMLVKLDSEIKWSTNPKSLITATFLGECL